MLTLPPGGHSQLRETSGDVVGDALRVVAGNTLRWKYVLNIPVIGSGYQVQLDYWMYLMDKSAMINRSFMTKFGMELGQVALIFLKQS